MSQPLPNIHDWFKSRATMRDEFLVSTGWGDHKPAPVGEDAAYRRYFRLTHATGRTAILMEAVPDGGAYPTPGHNMSDYMRITTYLRSLGLMTPAVYDGDLEEGYLLLQDFGNTSFKAALDQGVDRQTLYAVATDILKYLRLQAHDGDIELPDYYASHVHTGRRRLVDWFVPAQKGEVNSDGLVEEYLSVWNEIEKSIPPVPQGFLHIDYHFENLMWMPDKEGLSRCGILDFQGAMRGPLPYDLANLLEDARVDVPPELRREMLDRYCEGMTATEEAQFRDAYRVLATQFHCRVMGQFIRLAVRDGKPRYLQYLPRVAGYIRDALNDPVLVPLKEWLIKNQIDVTRPVDLDPVVIRNFIRPDAF